MSIYITKEHLPYYSNLGKLQFVLRDSSGILSRVITPEINLCKILPNKQLSTSNVSDLMDLGRVFGLKGQVKRHLRIVDQEGISNNMYLYNMSRLINGEYFLN